jgi:calcium-dependent protein kinase
MGSSESRRQQGSGGSNCECPAPSPAKNPRIEACLDRASSRLGTVAITGRYHRLPKKLEDDYDLQQKQVLGEGYNGAVFKAMKKQGTSSSTSRSQFAIKEFRRLKTLKQQKRDELEQECEVYLGMDHPHVARLVDVYEDEDRLSLVMECMAGGELFDRVIEKKKFSEKDAIVATHQMALAINYLHSHNVVHRDIKLENWLYESKDSDHLKLIDFGFSKIVDGTMKMSCGTLTYVAPEVLAKNYTSQCDLWSLGVVVFILLGGYMPFSGPDDQQQRNIKAGNYKWKTEKWDSVSRNGQDFVKKLMTVDPQVRLTATQAMEHPWLAQKDSHEPLDTNVVHDMCAFAQESKFRRACMLAMAWSLTNEERKKVRDAFLAIDTSHNGTISLGDFKKVVEENFHLTDEHINKCFEMLDVAHKGEIQYSEFLAATLSHQLKIHDELIHDTFRRFDVDNTGYLDESNMRDIFGSEMTDEEIAEIVKEIDENNDGKISYQEFVHYVRSNDHPKGKEALANSIIDQKSSGDDLEMPLQRVVSNRFDSSGSSYKPKMAPKT